MIRALPLALAAALLPAAASAQLPSRVDAAPPPAPVGAASDTAVALDRIVAVVGAQPILLSDVFTEIGYRRQQGMAAPRDEAELQRVVRQVVDDLVREELLVAEAKRQAVEVTDEDVAPQVERFVQGARQQVGSDERLAEELQRSGLGSIEQWRRSITEQLRKRELQERLLAKMRQEGTLPPAPVTDAQIAQYFDSLPNKPTRPALVGFRQIIVTPEATPAAKAAAKAKADSVRAELARGANFEEVAKRESMDGSAELGGDLGWIRRGKTVPEFERWVFSLPPGQMSPVVETSFGYHVIRVDRVQPSEVKARHILIMPKVDSADLARARLEADSVATAWRNGAPYDTFLANNHDPAEQSLVAEYQLDQLPPAYQTALGATAVNAITAPFEIDDPRTELPKLVVAQVMRKEEAGTYDLDDVRARLRQQLGEARAFDRFIDQLRGRTFVDVRLDDVGAR